LDHREAVALIKDALGELRGTWADIGAGKGTFTRALAQLLGPNHRIYAIDRDARALAALGRGSGESADIIAVEADFTRAFTLPEHNTLDGMLLANALHFVPDAHDVLARLAALLRPGGRVVFVEYDQSSASRWVPYPIPVARLSTLAAAAGLSTPVVTATRRSAFGGMLYAAAADRLV
jgi:SAM-dependent methyltransferase